LVITKYNQTSLISAENQFWTSNASASRCAKNIKSKIQNNSVDL